jgi:hypothetical protein
VGYYIAKLKNSDLTSVLVGIRLDSASLDITGCIWSARLAMSAPPSVATFKFIAGVIKRDLLANSWRSTKAIGRNNNMT